MEKIFNFLGSSEERTLAYAIYMLAGEVEYWWRGTRQMMESRGVVVDWDCFKRVFLEKYFSDNVRYAKEAEFMRLHQGNLFVFEYAIRFEHLVHFYSQAISEAWRCRKFVEGLRHELKRVIVPMSIDEFPALVEKAKTIERLEGGGSSGKATRVQEGSSGSRRGDQQRGPYDRPVQSRRGAVSRGPRPATPQSGAPSVRCYRCGLFPSGECLFQMWQARPPFQRLSDAIDSILECPDATQAYNCGKSVCIVRCRGFHFIKLGEGEGEGSR
uniref:Retrotransposon gag domain-containing protein n=1 Tax=Cajanus cajan TaxID=3821 RepID=A0A151S446_CAJCA|nr:hypothetical protein KK1_028706 [Cajanus cajan]